MYELYLLYHSRVARLLDRISLQSGLVDEMVHDTFLVVWKRASDSAPIRVSPPGFTGSPIRAGG